MATDQSNRNSSSDHTHVFELCGGPTYWAECACGLKFNRGNGVVCGSRRTVEAALAAA